MLLVEGHYSTAQSSLAMTCVKATTVVGTLLSGWAGDTLGLRFTLLSSFFFSALGFLFLPFHLGLIVLIASGMVAQFGNTATNGTIRLLLVKVVDRKNQKVALGWMRTMNNLGQILSYGLGATAAAIGLKLLIWFDGLTSFLALIVGAKIAPNEKKESLAVDISAPPNESESTPKNAHINESAPRSRGWWPFIGSTLLLAGWSFMYEFYMSGIAGKVKVIWPSDGLRIFSSLMVLNVMICALLAVKAAQFLKNVVKGMVAAAIFTAAGLLIGIYFTDSVPMLFVAAFGMTLGEVVYGVFGQFLLIRLVPASNRPNTLYSVAILVANLGRMAAAGLAFPLIIRASTPAPASILVIVVALGSIAVLALGHKRFEEATS